MWLTAIIELTSKSPSHSVASFCTYQLERESRQRPIRNIHRQSIPSRIDNSSACTALRQSLPFYSIFGISRPPKLELRKFTNNFFQQFLSNDFSLLIQMNSLTHIDGVQRSQILLNFYFILLFCSLILLSFFRLTIKNYFSFSIYLQFRVCCGCVDQFRINWNSQLNDVWWSLFNWYS